MSNSCAIENDGDERGSGERFCPVHEMRQPCQPRTFHFFVHQVGTSNVRALVGAVERK